MRKNWLALALFGVSVSAATTEAAVIGHWRFEGDQFLADSSGNNLTLSTSGTAPTQVANGAVASFDDPVPQSQDANANVASLGGSGNFTRADSTHFNVSTTGLTFETYFRKTANTSGTQYLASQNVANTGQRSWGIAFYGTGNTNNNLILVLSATGDASTVYPTQYTINNNTDYYLAWTHEPSTGTSRVYLAEVGDALGTPDTISTLTGLRDTPASFKIGAVGNNESRFNGYMDEVRLSSGILPTDDFLAVPEPGSAALLTAALGGLLMRRRRVASTN